METKTVILPAFMASTLINGDSSGLDESDESWVKLTLERFEGWRFVSCSEEVWYADVRSWNDLPGFRLGADAKEYTLIK